MKQMLLITLTALYFSASAQNPINAYFPSIGDTLITAVDEEPAPSFSNLITPPGMPQVWDLTGADNDDTDRVIYRDVNDAQNGGQFPGADLYIGNQTEGETFFDISNTEFRALGYSGSDPGGFGLQVVARFNPPFVERYAPLAFFDNNIQESFLSLPFSTDQLPDSLFSGLPIAPDSIRVRITTNRAELVDSYGTMKIPGGEYDVLRLKRTEISNTALDIHIPFVGWLDISAFGGGQFGEFLGADTTITHRFFADGVKEEIAVLTLNNAANEVQHIRYKYNGVVSAPESPEDAPGNAGVFAFPNPAVEWVRFDCVNLPPDEYTLKIFNIVGKQVWNETHFLSGNKSIRLDLQSFKKGTYMYSLLNKKGDVIGTKRLVVVKP